jgi:hypothetical protein
MHRFGLLHRIPPQPSERQQGEMPLELQGPEEFEEQELFVPADFHQQQEEEEAQHWSHGSHTHDHYDSGHDRNEHSAPHQTLTPHSGSPRTSSWDDSVASSSMTSSLLNGDSKFRL